MMLFTADVRKESRVYPSKYPLEWLLAFLTTRPHLVGRLSHHLVNRTEMRQLKRRTLGLHDHRVGRLTAWVEGYRAAERVVKGKVTA